MYDINRAWHEYYREQEPEKRGEILERFLKEIPDDGANEYRKLLFEKRHKGAKGQAEFVDRALYQCMNFSQIYKANKLFKRSSVKEIRKSMKELGFDEAEKFGAAGISALYWEIRNVAARYIKTGESNEYKRVAFGLLSSSESGRGKQMAKDIWQMTNGISWKYEVEEELRVWNDAIKAEYTMTVSDGEEKLRGLDAENIKR